jgi:hypothetical protein
MCRVEEFKPAGRSMSMAKKRVFISYDYKNDKNYRDLALAWDKNANHDFNFYDMSVED